MKYSSFSFNRTGGGEPLKTAPEMAEALGLTVRHMVAYMGHNAGPAAAFKVAGTQRAMGRTYYKPSIVKKWWRALLVTRPELANKHGL